MTGEIPPSAFSETERKGLARIGELPQQQWNDLQTLLADVDDVDESDVSRRDILKVISALGVGAVAGGLSTSQLVDAVSAAASTTDNDGNVGAPNNRVDVFADGINANSIEMEYAQQRIREENFGSWNVQAKNTTVSANSYGKIYDFSTPFTINSGLIYGPSIGAIKFRWTGSLSVDEFTFSNPDGNNSAGNTINIVPIPPVEGVVEISVKNTSASDEVYGGIAIFG